MSDDRHSFQTIIGLEVHVQLRTDTKLFCGCSTRFGASPNTQVCPVCLGLPGALPVINEKAIELSIKAGLALDCCISELTKWDRKQYFYPDSPKGYQISQFDLPICYDGFIEITDPSDDESVRHIGIIRAHLEEDAGKSIHDESARGGQSRIDLNRCGTPLLEIVSQPDLRSADEAKSYLLELKSRMTHLGISDCEMQEGSLRVDANVNLWIDVDGKRIATPIVEVKNMNSFRSVERAILHESSRQYEIWEQNGLTINDAGKTTRGWNDEKDETFLQREKEESADYRYFPDPDLLPILISLDQVESIRQTLGELPGQTRVRLEGQYGIKAYDADVIVNQGRTFIEYFETVAQRSGDSKRTAAWIGQEVLRTLNDQQIEIDRFPVSAQKLGELIGRISKNEIDNNRARDVFAHLMSHDVSVDEATSALGIEAVDDSETEAMCRELLAENPTVIADFKAGKKQALGSLIGLARKKNPNANPQVVREMLNRLVEEA
jgi:aspartyl-tRNA(Asn)/glutamyl-tRNA(Gln) amidotransferase subunit B